MSVESTGGMMAEKFKAKVNQGRVNTAKVLVERRVIEAQAHQPIDGRLSSKEDRNKKGYAQLNVRVPLDLKNQVIEERARRQAARVKNADVAAIVEEALRAFLARG